MRSGLDRRALLFGLPLGLGLPALVAPARLRAATPPRRPLGATGAFETVADWTFGRNRNDATIQDMNGLRRSFYFRYIYAGGQLDGLPQNYWAIHRDYPEGDPRSLHVFANDYLALKGRVPPGGGMRLGGIESGILRAKLPVTPGMYVEMRAKLPRGLGVWPAFWLNSGVEYPDGTFSALHWPPEIDIFEFFVWQGRTRPLALTGFVQGGGDPAAYGNPKDITSRFNDKGEYIPGIDFSETWNVFALDWVEDRPIWMLNGEPIKQTLYKWPGPPAHILVTNQIGFAMPGTNMAGMTAGGDDWDYCVDYLRVFKRT